jgi:CheY-like chemotaxis protein
VSRILVADDNSNIQKMVALALKDEGIDVVAVGNGEAAMRKIPDLRPDLVLADIFMPVRNGYEVCEFVKSDSRYMSTPVVLLVGAFDPLDEQETQRVRADGVLKKPFVPPDPLVNMVKALLAKSNGQKPTGIPAPIPPKPAAALQAAPQAVPPQITAEPTSQPIASSPMAPTPPQAPVQQQKPTSSVVPEQPPAFVSSPKQPVYQSTNTEDSDEVVTAVRDPNLGEPVWAAPEEPEETEEIEEESETKPADMLDMHSFGQDGMPFERTVEPDFRPDPALLDKDDFTDLGGNTPSQTQEARVQQHPQPNAAGQYVSDAAVAQYENDAPSSLPVPPEVPVEPFQFDPRLTFPAATQDSSIEEGSAAKENPVLAENGPTFAWPAVPNAPAGTPSNPQKPLDAQEQIQPIELDLPALPDHEAVITAATEAARLAFSELNTLPGSGKSFEHSDRNAAAAEHKNASSVSNTAKDVTSPSPEMIDAVVNRLLERMQPQIMEVVNREVLRPAIEAIVRREMKKN